MISFLKTIAREKNRKGNCFPEMNKFDFNDFHPKEKQKQTDSVNLHNNWILGVKPFDSDGWPQLAISMLYLSLFSIAGCNIMRHSNRFESNRWMGTSENRHNDIVYPKPKVKPRSRFLNYHFNVAKGNYFFLGVLANSFCCLFTISWRTFSCCQFRCALLDKCLQSNCIYINHKYRYIAQYSAADVNFHSKSNLFVWSKSIVIYFGCLAH